MEKPKYGPHRKDLVDHVLNTYDYTTAFAGTLLRTGARKIESGVKRVVEPVVVFSKSHIHGIPMQEGEIDYASSETLRTQRHDLLLKLGQGTMQEGDTVQLDRITTNLASRGELYQRVHGHEPLP